MKNPLDILRMKEQELLKVKRETEALRVTARLLDDGDESDWKTDPNIAIVPALRLS